VQSYEGVVHPYAGVGEYDGRGYASLDPELGSGEHALAMAQGGYGSALTLTPERRSVS
jgi:hypothetical protein